MSDRRLLTALLRTDLSSFIQRAFRTVSPGDHYLHNWHMDAISWAVQRCRKAKRRRLIITVPPRSGKSIAVSVALPAYILGLDPVQRIICASYSQELANKHARDYRAVMEADWYRAIFPRTRLGRDKNTQAEFVTTRKGGRLATSVGGTLTGRGGDFIILDDILNPDAASSEVQRAGVIEWVLGTCLSRLDDQEHGTIILIQQRVHEDDPVGFLLEKGGWTHLNLPAIAEETQIIPLGPNLVHVRQEDDVLHPERVSFERLMDLKKDMGGYAFAAQYQQNPAPRGGGIIKWEWFQTYDEAPEKKAGDLVVQSWDTASKADQIHDCSVCTTWLVRDGKFYLLHVLRKRLEYPALRKHAIAHKLAFDADEVLIEDAGSGTQLIQDLRNEGLNPRGIKPEGDKVIRMETQTGALEAKRVFVPKSAPWLADFQDEVTKFPKAKYDDQVDSLSQFLKWTTRPRDHGPRPMVW
jgi:predicted phage terminase large subunit-like protein